MVIRRLIYISLEFTVEPQQNNSSHRVDEVWFHISTYCSLDRAKKQLKNLFREQNLIIRKNATWLRVRQTFFDYVMVRVFSLYIINKHQIKVKGCFLQPTDVYIYIY